MKGDEDIGRRSKQRRVGRSPLCNQYLVLSLRETSGDQQVHRDVAERYGAKEDSAATVSVETGVCHCLLSHACPADAIINECRTGFPHVCDRDDDKGPSSIGCKIFFLRSRLG